MRSGEQEQNSALRKRVASAHATESVRTRASPSPCRPATRRPKNCHRQRQQRQPFLVPMRTTTRRSMRRHPKSRGPIRATPLVRMGAIQPPAADDAEGSSLVCATDCGTIVFSLLATRYFARYSLLRQQTPLKKSLRTSRTRRASDVTSLHLGGAAPSPQPQREGLRGRRTAGL
jgi:hypothetical protein